MEGTNERQQIVNRYKDLHALRKQKLLQIKKQSNFVALLRLTLFVLAFAIPFVFFESWSIPFFLVFGVLFTLFLFFVFLAYRLGQLKKENQTYLNLYNKELQVIDGEWTNESDGSEFVDPEHDFSHDLDLFGRGSLYQYINRSATKEGSKKLADKLCSISLDREELESKQEAIKELADDPEFREEFFVRASLVEESGKKKRDLDLYNQPDLDFVSGMIRYVILVFPILTVLILVLAALKMIPSSSILLWFFVGLGVTGQYFRKVNRVHSEITTLGGYLSNYSSLIKLFENYKSESHYLTKLKQQLETNGKTASETVKSLGKAIQFIDQRLNMLMGAILNGFFLWDLFACLALQKWYKNYGSKLVVWIDTLTEVEALNSFATFAYNHQETVWPKISDKVILNATDLGHPLIPQQERVCNDFSIDDDHRICVVTGANMAGKSTFLRTVGVNLILAGNGCKVTAKKFVYKPLVFITNMRAIDNLLKHESYFFAELSRLQMIVERLKKKGELFFILDEILKGTNSHDKTMGSIALIKQLLRLNGSGIVATHDLELGELQNEHPGKIFNNCFEVSFEGDGLQFDYKLRSGVTQSHNASFLMRKMGLIPVD